MTDTPDAAVRIARDAWDESATRPGGAWLATRAVVAALHERGWLHDPAEIEALRALVTPPVDPWQVVGLGQARELLWSLDARNEALRARIAELEGDLAAAESTIAALEDPETRAALTTLTTGDYGPVPDLRKD